MRFFYLLLAYSAVFPCHILYHSYQHTCLQVSPALLPSTYADVDVHVHLQFDAADQMGLVWCGVVFASVAPSHRLTQSTLPSSQSLWIKPAMQISRKSSSSNIFGGAATGSANPLLPPARHTGGPVSHTHGPGAGPGGGTANKIEYALFGR